MSNSRSLFMQTPVDTISSQTHLEAQDTAKFVFNMKALSHLPEFKYIYNIMFSTQLEDLVYSQVSISGLDSIKEELLVRMHLKQFIDKVLSASAIIHSELAAKGGNHIG
jgi:hypothetical protein